jgi:macrolide-specific efflux system membrane fusion protein
MSTKWLTENSSVDRSRIHLWKLFILLITAAVLLASSGCSLLPEEPEEEEIPDISPPKLSKKPEYTVKTGTLETKVRGVGKIMSVQEEVLFFPEGSTAYPLNNKRIKAIYVKSGEQAEAGQLVAELDVVDMENTLRRKRIEFRRVEQDFIVNTLRGKADKDPLQYEQEVTNFERQRLDIVELEEAIKRSKIYAPFPGTVVSVSTAAGAGIQPYDPVVTIADLNQLTVTANISKDDLQKIAVGMEAVVDINAAGQFKGKVKLLPTLDRNTNPNNGRGFPYDPYNGNKQPTQESVDMYLQVELEPFPEQVTRGTPLSVAVITDRRENAVIIPPSVLRTHGGRTFVQVVEADGTKREVDVEVGQQTPTDVEIVKGL